MVPEARESLLKRLWGTWAQPIIAPVVAALIVALFGTDLEDGLMNVLSAITTPITFWAIGTGVLAFGAAKGSERLFVKIVGSLPKQRFRELGIAIEKEVRRTTNFMEIAIHESDTNLTGCGMPRR